MPQSRQKAQEYINEILSEEALETRQKRLKGLIPCEDLETIPASSKTSLSQTEKRWSILAKHGHGSLKETLYGVKARDNAPVYQGNIENFIGTVQLPLGVAGPIRINGVHASGDYYIPLATTEAALVASYHRGCCAVKDAGGCSVVLIQESISRSPGFAFKNLYDAMAFCTWVVNEFDALKKVAESTTQHGKLLDMQLTLEGNHVYLHFEFTTGDAAGQNIATIATQAACDYLANNSIAPIEYQFVEANMSGDKKASMLAFLGVRGKKATAEVFLSEEIVKKRLRSTPEGMVNYWRMSALGGVMSGTIGVQGHFANGLAAFYIACGQDAACVSESSIGVTRMELKPDGSLYASATLPNIIVGTVGGGTGLPSQKACLELMGLYGNGKVRALAEVVTGLALAGELSIIAALSSGQFTKAHQRLARLKSDRKTKD